MIDHITNSIRLELNLINSFSFVKEKTWSEQLLFFQILTLYFLYTFGMVDPAETSRNSIEKFPKICLVIYYNFFLFFK